MLHAATWVGSGLAACRLNLSLVFIDFFINFLYNSLLLMAAVLADGCIQQECDKTQLIPAVENQTIDLQPCDVCTECLSSEPDTVQATWYYKLPNGSRTDNFNATVQGRGYVISVS